MRRHWERCDNCLAFVHRGDIGECHAGGPAVPSATYSGVWPQVSPTDWCRRFTFDPTPLYAEIERLNGVIDRMEQDHERAEWERRDGERENIARVALPVLDNQPESES